MARWSGNPINHTVFLVAWLPRRRGPSPPIAGGRRPSSPREPAPWRLPRPLFLMEEQAPVPVASPAGLKAPRFGSRIQGGEDPPPHLRHCQCRRMRSGSNSLANGFRNVTSWLDSGRSERACPALRRPSPVPSSAVRVSDYGGDALRLVFHCRSLQAGELHGCRQSHLVAAGVGGHGLKNGGLSSMLPHGRGSWLVMQRGGTQRLLPPRRKNTDASVHSSDLFRDHFKGLDFTCC